MKSRINWHLHYLVLKESEKTKLSEQFQNIFSNQLHMAWVNRIVLTSSFLRRINLRLSTLWAPDLQGWIHQLNSQQINWPAIKDVNHHSVVLIKCLYAHETCVGRLVWEGLNLLWQNILYDKTFVVWTSQFQPK